MVELIDGSTIAQLGVTDMRLPIQYAFSYPDRWGALLPPLDLTRCGALEFLPPDTARFPCLRLAYDALIAGGTMPVALNAANEVAVEAFLAGRLPFPAIAQDHRTDAVGTRCAKDRLAGRRPRSGSLGARVLQGTDRQLRIASVGGRRLC